MKEKSFLGHSALGFHRIAYTQWGKATERPPVICVHGLTRNGRDFDKLAETLQAEAQVFCPDMPGRGRSDKFGNPAFYAYPQYLADVTAFIARVGSESIDWVGTSMGGIIGMMLAAAPRSPIRRLVINDVGPLIPLPALKHIAAYVYQAPVFPTLAAAEEYMRDIYAPFGITEDDDWHRMAIHGTRRLPDGAYALAHDPAIAQNFAGLTQDVDLWDVYDAIRCPTLVLRGTKSEILSAETAQAMTERGPKPQLIQFPGIGHAPALLDPTQIAVIAGFLKA